EGLPHIEIDGVDLLIREDAIVGKPAAIISQRADGHAVRGLRRRRSATLNLGSHDPSAVVAAAALNGDAGETAGTASVPCAAAAAHANARTSAQASPRSRAVTCICAGAAFARAGFCTETCARAASASGCGTAAAVSGANYGFINFVAGGGIGLAADCCWAGGCASLLRARCGLRRRRIRRRRNSEASTRFRGRNLLWRTDGRWSRAQCDERL